MSRLKKQRIDTRWSTLYDNLIRHLVTFLDYKDAFATRRVAKAWQRSLDDKRQQQFLSPRAALHLSYALFELLASNSIVREHVPAKVDGKDAWSGQPTAGWAGA